MFYRRKLILSLLQSFDGQLYKISLQKLLFLLTIDQTKRQYDFIPYKFGCYSYSANADLTAMVQKGILSETSDKFFKTDKADYIAQLKPEDKSKLAEVVKRYGKMDSRALMKHTYLNFPFYAINSTVADQVLSPSEFEKVKSARPSNNETVLYTIGYEGISLEEYLVRLLKNDVKVLIDVRNNPLSMKYGFSKSQLTKYCQSIGIQYIHFPEVGIQSEQRRELNTQSDYDSLFADYRLQNLTQTTSTQQQILFLLKEHKRVALTCFEANICQCHRLHLAEAIKVLPTFTYKVKHI